MSMRLRKKIAVAISIVCCGLVLAKSAAASHTDSMRPTANYSAFCATDNFCQTDNISLTYFRQGTLNDTSKATIAAVLNNQFNPTDLNVSHQNPPVYTGGSETDVIYQRNASLRPGVSAVTWCNDPIDSVKCDQHYVAFYNDFWAQTVTCHETGHAVGLTHGEDASPAVSSTDPSLACMRTYPHSNAPGLGSHNAGQINGTY